MLYSKKSPPHPECSVNDVACIKMLEEFFILTLEEESSNDMLFQQDGMPFNFHVVILEFLNRNFCVFLTVHLCIILDNDHLDTHLLYFTMRLL